MKNKLLLFIFLLNSFIGFSQVDTVFWFVVPEVSWQHSPDKGEPVFFRVSSLSTNTVIVKFEMPALDSVLGEIELKPFQSKNFDATYLVRDNYNINNPATGADNDPNKGLANDANILESGLPGMEGVYQPAPGRLAEKRGLKISSRSKFPSTKTNEITVYCDRFNKNNKDLFSLKGKNALGYDFTIPGQISEPIVSSITSNPATLCAFDIVASQDNTKITITPTSPMKKEGNVNPWPAGVPLEIVLYRGETFSCVSIDYQATNFFGGSTVTSDKPIAITWKDDSLQPGQDGGYDLAGDQLIPDILTGKEYLVMRGQLGDPEYAYVTAVESGTTTVEYTGGGSFTLSDRGKQKRIGMNVAAGVNPAIDALHILADKRIHVLHITGTGSEVGGGVVPTIDLCTGSKDVSIVRSLTDSGDAFYINIMTDSANIGDFKVYVGSQGPDSLNPAWFSRCDTTDWYYLTSNNFTNAKGTSGNPYYIHSIGKDSVIRFINPGRFHLSVIENSSGGCKYGYFSSFSVDTVGSSVGSDAGNSANYCWGDIVQLNASGGKTDTSYYWEFLGSDPLINEWISRRDTSPAYVRLKPNGALVTNYRVTVTPECPLDPDNPTEYREPEVKVYEKIELNWTATVLADSCSPAKVEIENNPQAWVNYIWTINDSEGSKEIEHKITYLENPVAITNMIEYMDNTTLSTQSYDIEVVANQNYQCQETQVTTLQIFPNCIAAIDTVAPNNEVVICSGDSITFQNITASAFDQFIWDFGDGYRSPLLDSTVANMVSVTHTFTNNLEKDTTYSVWLSVYKYNGGLGTCIDSAEIVVTVHDNIKALFSPDGASTGCNPLNVDFVDFSIGNPAKTYYWDYGNGITSTNTSGEIIQYENTGISPLSYDAKLVITSVNGNCKDSLTIKNITVYPQPEVYFSPDVDSICNGDSITYTIDSLIPAGVPVT
ncbi:MAG: IgGFc-binding protein [Salinivirgaceae bacterium]|nr:IgGFc-binding protein [Salinivirgaceae bacterium]